MDPAAEGGGGGCAGDPYRRPARRAQWLVSALACHYGLDRGVENEIIVLATGLDQYLQEIFHHLDCAGEGRIPSEDFRTLCRVLGLLPPPGRGAQEQEQEHEHEQEEHEQEEEGAAAAAAGLCHDLAPELTFRQFHAKLCGYFSTKAGCPAGGPGGGRGALARLPVGQESEHIETQIRLRSPLRRRRSGEGGRRGPPGAASQLLPPAAAAASPPVPPPPVPPPGACCSRECYEEVVALEQAEDRIVKLEDENGSLRELVEDMRAALQSSDARCLALQVGLWKSHANHKQNGTCFIGSWRHLTNSKSQTSKCLQSVLKEVELIRSSRDGQIEEAIRFNQEMEKELKSSHEALAALADCNRSLKREQAEMRKKVEEARHAVLNSLGKVKELEVEAHKVPKLQTYIQQLESELQYCRSKVLKFQAPSEENSGQKGSRTANGQYALSVLQQDRSSPTGGAGMSENVEEQMFRSVEGQAASDEEEEKWTGDQQSQVAEVKKLLARFPRCSNGCDDIMKTMIDAFVDTSKDGHEKTHVELIGWLSRLTEQLELKGQEVKTLEINMEEENHTLLRS